MKKTTTEDVILYYAVCGLITSASIVLLGLASVVFRDFFTSL